MSRIADRFGRAAATYEAATPIQHRVAERLAEAVLATGTAPQPRVAEFGCGAGRLARILSARLRASLWIATDIAPAMAAAARGASPLVAVMDGARPALADGFDLVCSSLALQWMDDPAATVARWRGLLRPGGRLAVATLVQGSFAEWRSALAEAGAGPAGPRFATESEARAWFGPDAAIETLTLTERHPGALQFLRALHASGADAAETPPLDAGRMRRAMRAFEAAGSSVTYAALIAVERV